VAEYNMWSQTFLELLNTNEHNEQIGAVVVPMAGLGQRFVDEGYTTTKPLILVSGKAMVVQAANDLPKAKDYVFVLRGYMLGHENIAKTLQETYHNCIIKTINSVTEGQACTALIGLEELEKKANVRQWVTFGACDNGMLYDQERFAKLTEDQSVDIIVWAVRGHANAIRHPEMFGWIDADEIGDINCISVKKPLNSPKSDPIVIGAFSFRHAQDYHCVIDRLIKRNGRVNGEFYIDSCINDAIEMGLKCKMFEVDSFVSWGTPNDLKTFEYWQSCFHKWTTHPYRLELDERVEKSALKNLKMQYATTIPDLPESD